LSVYSALFGTGAVQGYLQRSGSMAVNLFVGGLSFSTSNDRLREVFAATGNVESAAVVTDRDTGRSRGFGFVEMATPEDAEQAISKLNGTSVDGRTIQVERAKSPGAGGGDRRGGGGGGGGRRRPHAQRLRPPRPGGSPPSHRRAPRGAGPHAQLGRQLAWRPRRPLAEPARRARPPRHHRHSPAPGARLSAGPARDHQRRG